MKAIDVLADRLVEFAPTPRPRLCGVYLLIAGEEVVYVGQSEDIEGRLGYHIAARNNPTGRRTDGKEFDRAVWFSVPNNELDDVEGALIRFLRPKYNNSSPTYRKDDNRVLVRLGFQPYENEGEAIRDYYMSHPKREARIAAHKEGARMRKVCERARRRREAREAREARAS